MIENGNGDGAFLSIAMDDIKKYYINGEQYDWVDRPRRLEKIFHRLRERATVKLIKRYSRCNIVLDAGCGTGLITRHLDGTIIGLDINNWNITRAHQHAPQACYIVADLENLPLGNETIDLVVCTETLEHLSNPERTISEFARILRPAGKLIGSVPHRHPVWNFRKMLLTTCPVKEPFHHQYTTSQVKLMLTGLKIEYLARSIFGMSVFFVTEKVQPPQIFIHEPYETVE